MLMKTADSTIFAYICARVLYCTCNKNQVLVLVLIFTYLLEAWVLVLVLEGLGTCYISGVDIARKTPIFHYSHYVPYV